METPIESPLEETLRLLTIKEAAALLNVSPRSVHRMVLRKHMRAARVGGQWRIRRTEIAKWMQDLNEL